MLALCPQSWWVLPDEESVNLWYDCLYYNTTQTWVCSSVSNSGEFGTAPTRVGVAQGGGMS